jgi:hypothetical protein
MNIAAPKLALDLRPHEELARTTTCTLAISIDDVAVWPVRGEDDARLEIQIDDLLAHLTDFWKPLMLRQVYPIEVNPLRPSDLRRESERRWTELPAGTVDLEEDAVSRFEEAHDLARAFAGVYGLPPFWIVRSGDKFIVETAGALWRLSFAGVRDVLSATGDWICGRLAQADGERWVEPITAWRERALGDEADLLAWSTGLDRTLATSLIRDGALDAPRDFEDAAKDDDELRIAARMAGALPPEQVREIIALARQFGHGDAPRLRALSKACLQHIAERFDRAVPFQQGEAAARFVRERLDVPADGPVQVFEIATWFGIDVRHAPAEPPTLDGLAIWGSRFGPGVFLNETSGRILSRGNVDVPASSGARVTLAHELCHLLLDGAHALSAIEVLKARMPIGVEQRAKSFAGEFLLPTQIAARHWLDAGRPANRTELDALIQNLVDTYQVTRSVAAWKVEHAAREYEVDLGVILDAVAPRR